MSLDRLIGTDREDERDVRLLMLSAGSYYRDGANAKQKAKEEFEKGLLRMFKTDAFQTYASSRSGGNMLISPDVDDPKIILGILDSIGEKEGWTAEETIFNIGPAVQELAGDVDDFDSFSAGFNAFASNTSQNMPGSEAKTVSAGDTLVAGYEEFDEELELFENGANAVSGGNVNLGTPLSDQKIQEALKYTIGELAPPELVENVRNNNETSVLASGSNIYKGQVSEIIEVPVEERVGRGTTDLDALAAARRGESVEATPAFVDQGGAAIVEEELAKGDDAFAGFAGFIGGQVPSQEQQEESTGEQPGGPGGGNPSNAARMMAEREADRDEIYSLLQEQFGGASYFFRDQALNMLLGVTADGTIVSYDDESRETEIKLMDYIVNNGITSMTRVKGLLQKTEWWQTTDVARRTYDVMWGEMSDPERQEFLEPTTDALTKEAQFLGFDLSEQDAFTLAQTLAKNGDSEDTEAIREIIFSQLQMQNTVSELSGFAAQKDNLRQLARSYYAPLPEQGEGSIEQWAELLYTGESTVEAYEQNLKQIAVSRFPTLDKVIREMGLTPGQYFAPYKQQIESMLGRNVDLYNEFSDVIEYIPDGGTDARAMNLSEVKNFVRALPEWQQTDDAKDQARALAFSIGQTFGEVA